MSADYTLEYHRDYIHIKHSENFEITPERMEKFWDELTEICKKYKCRNVLAEAVAPKRQMYMINAYKSGTRASQVAQRLSLACCFHEYKPDEVSEFFKTVAENRGVRVEFFTNLKDALQWLGVEQTEDTIETSSKTKIR